MYICKLIHQEIQKISEFKLDLNTFDNENYDALIERINNELLLLKKIKKILDLEKEHLSMISDYCVDRSFEIENNNLEDLFATDSFEITEKTIFFIGDLYFKQYKDLVDSNSTELPSKLKFIFGEFEASETNIESVNLEYASDLVSVDFCNNLKSVEINQGTGGSILCHRSKRLETLIVGNMGNDFSCWDCLSLVKLVVGDVLGNLDFRYCINLILENISSIHGENHKIAVGSSIAIGNSGLIEHEDNELLAKFNTNSINRI